VVLGLKEDDRSWRFAPPPSCVAQPWRLVPAFRATGSIDGGTIGAMAGAENGFDPAEGIAHRGDGI